MLERSFTSRTGGATEPSGSRAVLCVDLDGTLLATDILRESVLLLLVERPWLAFVLPFWLLRGKAFLKRQVADRVTIDVARLPYRDEVVRFITEQSMAGRHIVLATATDETVARPIARHLGLFAEVIASDGCTNLSGERKAACLTSRFGTGMFDYAGNDHVDIPAWTAGGRAIIVAPSRRLLRRVRRMMTVEQVLAHRRGLLRPIVRVMRPQQWVKNLLLFVPLITSHRLLEPALIGTALTAFAAFNLCASAVYILNDLLDIQSDRQHPRKRYRPFAAGELGVGTGMALVPLLLIAAFAIAVRMLSASFAGMLALYLVVTTAYSFRLKKQPVLDVMVLAGLYAFRVLAGGVAVGIVISEWLLPFALFLFLSLAVMKRYSELRAAPPGEQTLSGRGYRVEDASLLQAAGIGSAYLAVLVLALYISSDEVTALYSTPRILWGLCPLVLYWVTRTWFRAHRGWIQDDPVVAAVKDPASYIVAAIGALLLLAAM